MLEPFLATGKPVIVTEFGMRTFRGAESSGALGFGVTDGQAAQRSTRLPLIGRFVRPRLTGTFQRDEAMQAREVAETLDELERAGVAGALLSTFATPEGHHRRRSSLRPRHGLHVPREGAARRATRHGLPGHALGTQGGVRRGGSALRRSLTGGHAADPAPDAARPGSRAAALDRQGDRPDQVHAAPPCRDPASPRPDPVHGLVPGRRRRPVG